MYSYMNMIRLACTQIGIAAVAILASTTFSSALDLVLGTSV
jgi:hypothetical protein